MSLNEEDLRKAFLTVAPALQSWGGKVDKLILDILSENSIDTTSIKIQPKFRVKEIKSFISKALYRDKLYKNPLVDIEDKIGTRLVVLKTDEVRDIARILNAQSSNWQSKISKDIENEIEERPKEFDYQSIHVVVKPLKNDRDFDPSLNDILTCEIQIRSLLQHAFAEVSHDSVYKGPYKNDKEIVRKLSKTIALMEATDDYFLEVFRLMRDEKRYYSNLLNELFELYKRFDGKFSKDRIDYALSDILFSLVDDRLLNLQDVKDCAIKNERDIKTLLATNDFHIASQPLVLLVAYMIYERPKLLQRNWPLSKNILTAVYSKLGVSYENY